ncbi:MAG: DUF3179 domain-containing protein [Rhodothermaceae bacterium]|nr:DUF3179 domain-containing protein [Rhodothermaceae bacterium]
MLLLSVISILFTTSCDSVSSDSETGIPQSQDGTWLIPENQIFVGAGKDGIPSVDGPSFSTVGEISFMQDDELILGIKVKDEIKGYPHSVLNYHEIINDRIADIPVAITFCPLTGSGTAWSRVINGEETTFGVSGLIHKNNLIAYDRATNNFWSQMKEMSVHGSLQREKTATYQLVEMNWKAWRESFPESQVMNRNTGFARNYHIYPYGRNYNRDNNNIIFPIHREDDRLERKALAHGVYYDIDLHIFPFDSFQDKIQVIHRTINGNDIVVAGSLEYEMVISLSRETEDGTVLTFTESEKELPVLMADNEGNEWNVFGECISGSRIGERLSHIPAYNAYWFAWVDFYGDGPRSPIIVFP